MTHHLAAQGSPERDLPTLDEYRNNLIEECAKIAELYRNDEPETVRMVNYRCEIAARIRALAIPSTNNSAKPTPIGVSNLAQDAERDSALGTVRGTTFSEKVPLPHGVEDTPEIRERMQKALAVPSTPAQGREGRGDLADILREILDVEQEFRNAMPPDWEGDPLHDACERGRLYLNSRPASPLSSTTLGSEAK
jgi:hypothetical protein